MSALIYRSCRASRNTFSQYTRHAKRCQSSKSWPNGPQEPVVVTESKQHLDIEALLAEPTWSVRDELIPKSHVPLMEPETGEGGSISSERLHHMLRLSALPYPKTRKEEEKMLREVAMQLYFVRKIREVDTEGVEPLQSITDETEQGRKEATIGLEELKEALAKEDTKGRSRRPRRRKEVVDTKGVENWDVLGTASEKVETPGGNYFIVRSGKEIPH